MTSLPPKPLANVAFTAAGLFALVSAGLSRDPRARWVEYPGIGFHLTLLPLIAQLPAPAWARAMGYAWVAVDTAVAGAILNGAPPPAATPYRLGGHVLAAVWLAGAAQALPTPARWLERAAAGCLGGHSLLAPLHFYQNKPPVLLYVAGPLLIGWLAVVGGLLRRGTNQLVASGFLFSHFTLIISSLN